MNCLSFKLNFKMESIFRPTISLFSKSLVIWTLATTASAHAKSEGREEGDIQCALIPRIEAAYLAQHIKFSAYSDELKTRVVSQFVKHLDPSKMFFVESDVGLVKTRMKDIFVRPKERDCMFMFEIYDVLKVRVKERVAFVKETLNNKKFKFDKSIEVDLDSDKRQTPKDKKEAEVFLLKYIHFQVANYLASDTPLAEAKKNVIKNWERTQKRIAETKTDDMYAAYLDSFASSLDPHSTFYSRDPYQDFQIGMGLSLEGIGATLSSQDGFTIVEALVPGGAAARSGLLKVQDKIVAVAQGEKGKFEDVMDMDLRDVVRKIRGPKGTLVRLAVMRAQGGKKDRVELSIKRDKVNLEDEAVQVTYVDKEISGQKKTVAVINLPSFYSDPRAGGRSSAADMKKAITGIREKKVSAVVLDLSWNPGGSLEDAVRIAGLFFQTGNVVKQTGREESDEAVLADKDSSVDWAGPLVILISRMSASASEIVAGTLQDYKRAVVVGSDHTFGKGTVQQVIPFMNDLAAIKTTIGMFYTPGGNSTQHRGVSADVVLPSILDMDDNGEKTQDYSLPPRTISAFLSESAQGSSIDKKWVKIDDKSLEILKAKSKERVSKSEDFKKIIEETQKAKARGKIVKLSEITSESKKKEKEKTKSPRSMEKDEREKEYLKRADLQEAISVALDLSGV